MQAQFEVLHVICHNHYNSLNHCDTVVLNLFGSVWHAGILHRSVFGMAVVWRDDLNCQGWAQLITRLLALAQEEWSSFQRIFRTILLMLEATHKAILTHGITGKNWFSPWSWGCIERSLLCPKSNRAVTGLRLAGSCASNSRFSRPRWYRLIKRSLYYTCIHKYKYIYIYIIYIYKYDIL